MLASFRSSLHETAICQRLQPKARLPDTGSTWLPIATLLKGFKFQNIMVLHVGKAKDFRIPQLHEAGYLYHLIK